MGGWKSLSMGQKISTFARGKLGQQVGSGECYALASAALRAAGARSASDYGTISDDADYVWGDEIDAKDALPGDIIQFRDYVITTETVTVSKTTKKDGSGRTETDTSTTTEERPHHTAVVIANDGKGVLTILEQNVRPAGAKRAIRKVLKSRLRTTSRRTEVPKKVTRGRDGSVHEVKTTVTVKVEGTIWVYRPKGK